MALIRGMIALTPEELDALLEDAFVLRDRAMLDRIFEPDALVAAAGSHAQGAAIGAFVAAQWSASTYVAQPRQVLQAGHTALIVAQHSLGVARRAADARWRYAIALLETMKGARP